MDHIRFIARTAVIPAKRAAAVLTFAAPPAARQIPAIVTSGMPGGGITPTVTVAAPPVTTAVVPGGQALTARRRGALPAAPSTRQPSVHLCPPRAAGGRLRAARGHRYD